MSSSPDLFLKSVRYAEFEGEPKEWLLQKSKFNKINLIVGLNSSGKTRLLNVINGISVLLQNKLQRLWHSGTFEIEFLIGKKNYKYALSLRDQQIKYEELYLEGKKLLIRDSEGNGTIWGEELKKEIKFKIPNNMIAAYVKRDEIQHPFLDPLFLWASSVRRYEFGSELGKSLLHSHFDFSVEDKSREETSTEAAFPSSADPNQVVSLYIAGYKAFRDKFDKAILQDFSEVGYDCEEVGAYPFEDIQLPIARTVPVGIFVKERDLNTKTRQIEMSMGMYRCLALIINLNYSIMTKQAMCILIDDIGEGLDYERSVKLIKLFIKKCSRNKFQLIMSTNDRFVMNEVQLKYWHIIERYSSKVRLLDYGNSKKAFDGFKYLGLSNFDFFVSEAYREKETIDYLNCKD